MRKISNMIVKAKREGNYAEAKLLNPKAARPQVGPLSVMTYFNGRNLDLNNVTYSTLESREARDTTNTREYTVEEVLDVARVEALTHMWGIESIGFLGATLYWEKGLEGKVGYIDIQFEKGLVSPIIFPHAESNVGIYKNSEGRLSFVSDGRVELSNGELKSISTNQEALREYVISEDPFVNFTKLLTSRQWQLSEDDKNGDSDIPAVKSIMWIGYTDYIDFPTYDDGFPINVVWLDKQRDKNGEWYVPTWDEYSMEDLEGCIRVSSLSQNGVVASAGRLVNEKFIDPKPFFGKKAKFDISANQAVKNFKLATPTNKGKKVFVALAEIQSQSDLLPVNAHGNIVTTEQALDTYITKLTKEEGLKRGISHPAHKVFTKINGEIVRVKGAAHCMDITGVIEGNTEDKIVVLPPSEVAATGELEEDLDKFQFLVNFGEELKEATLTVNHPDGTTQEIETVGMYIEIYEDAYHSAVTSLKQKEQNIFYYGGVTAIYQKNGWDKLVQEFSRSIDHIKLGNVMNIANKAKSAMKEIKLEDIK